MAAATDVFEMQMFSMRSVEQMVLEGLRAEQMDALEAVEGLDTDRRRLGTAAAAATKAMGEGYDRRKQQKEVVLRQRNATKQVPTMGQKQRQPKTTTRFVTTEEPEERASSHECSHHATWPRQCSAAYTGMHAYAASALPQQPLVSQLRIVPQRLDSRFRTASGSLQGVCDHVRC